MKRLIPILVVLTIAVGLTVGLGARPEARPSHLKVFAAAYPQVAARNKMVCSVCHVASDKKLWNNYGKALAKNIEIREQDEARIRAAMEQTEPEPSAIRGKTFGDLLKLGLLPASKAVEPPE